MTDHHDSDCMCALCHARQQGLSQAATSIQKTLRLRKIEIDDLKSYDINALA